MIEQTLGLPIDIHGGGIDLVFPHHENERAQGVCATHDHEYSAFWLHNGFLNFGDEKMSKSLGNVALAHDLLKTVPGEAIRWALLSAHYRQPAGVECRPEGPGAGAQFARPSLQGCWPTPTGSGVEAGGTVR